MPDEHDERGLGKPYPEMINSTQTVKWQEIGWNGLFFSIPASWEPTVIYPNYLFFEFAGRAVFEIKWQKINGRYSPGKILEQIRKSFKEETRLQSWDIPTDLTQLLPFHSVTGFELQRLQGQNQGVIIFCPVCEHATLMQWFFDTEDNRERLAQIFASFQDHTKQSEQVWTLYDIRARLPVDALLKRHEFLPGKYTISFELMDSLLTLYRYKPAAAILHKKSISEFGKELLNYEPLAEGKNWASWSVRAQGIEMLLEILRRKPLFQWMRLWHITEQNVILGVRAEAKRFKKTGWLEKICENYSSLESH